MWVARIKYKHEDCVTMPKAVARNVSCYAMPGNSTVKSEFIYNTGFLLLSGDEKAKKKFVADLQKDKRVVKVEANGDLISFVEKLPMKKKEHSVFRSRDIFCIKPVFCNPKDGYEYWEVATWEKSVIAEFVKKANLFGQAKLLGIRKMAVRDFYYLRLAPQLSPKQKEAIELAHKHGYYDMPKKVELSELGKKLKISGQAFSERLRGAERKLLPALVESYLK